MTFLLLAIATAFAATPPDKCDFESLTDGCQLFDAKAPYKISMPDGTFIPNIAALEEGAKGMKGLGDAEMRRKSVANDQADENRALDAMQILDEVPSAKMNNKLKFWLANHLTLAQEMAAGITRTGETLRLPWPPADQTASSQNVAPAEVGKRLREILGKERGLRLRGLGQGISRQDMLTIMLDSFRERHPLFDEMNTIKPERAARVRELVDFAKNQVIDSITSGKPESRWSKEEAAAVKKVRGIVYTAGDSSALSNATECMGITPNAYYEANTHSINICKGFYNYPDLTLVGVLAHEITHSVDPCAAQFPYYTIDTAKLEALTSSGTPQELEKNEDLKAVLEILKKTTKDGAKITAFPFPLILGDQKNLDYFIERGVIKPEGENQPFTQSGQDVKGYIFADVYKCLLDDKSANLREVTPEQIERVVKTATERRLAVSGPEYDREADAARIRAAFSKFPQCLSPDASTQMREAISDAVGSKAEGAFVRGKKLEGPTDRLTSVAYFASLVCQARSQAVASRDMDGAALTASRAKSVVAEERDAHPGDKVRIERIFLTNPDLRAAMGCGPAPTGACVHQSTAVDATKPTESGSHQ